MFCVVAIVNRFTVHIKRLAAGFNGITFNGNNSLDEKSFPVMGGNENTNVTAVRFMDVKNFYICSRNFYTIDKLAHQNLVADEERVLHRPRWNSIRFDEKRSYEPKNDNKNNDNQLHMCPAGDDEFPKSL